MNDKPHYDAHYTTTAKALHWLMALLLLGLLALGFIMSDMPLSPQKLQMVSWHKWAGVSAFLLVLVRVSWRISHRPPPLPWQMGKLQQIGAHLGHLGRREPDHGAARHPGLWGVFGGHRDPGQAGRPRAGLRHEDL